MVEDLTDSSQDFVAYNGVENGREVGGDTWSSWKFVCGFTPPNRLNATQQQYKEVLRRATQKFTFSMVLRLIYGDKANAALPNTESAYSPHFTAGVKIDVSDHTMQTNTGRNLATFLLGELRHYKPRTPNK